MESRLFGEQKVFRSRCFRGLLALLLLFAFSNLRATAQEEVPKVPMQPVYEDGAEARWLAKKVLNSRNLDSMEDLSTWSFQGDGDMVLSESPC